MCIDCHHKTHDGVQVMHTSKMSKSSHVLLVKKTSIEDPENTTQAETADLRPMLCSVKAPGQVYATLQQPLWKGILAPGPQVPSFTH